MRKDEEIERTLRVYSKSSTFEYIPRSKKEDDYVVARPMKAPKCVTCGKTEPEPFECEFCHEYYCEDHLPAEKHECPGLKEGEMSPEDEAAIKRAIVAKMENIVGRLPAVYMLIDSAKPDELRAFLEALETMENLLTDIVNREEEQ
ncbi:MAG TPA: AN1-type zinc finger domain-containing protein [Methanocella sp.]|uniref:AN1-type zinc finger domain-containing protein n=1 Tax=Methanocella sp. TaxID=2052833 RepID=UPI002C0EB8D2|nr:AN1-type zinc finger domain-containing protein [Methanocella sp.]HTY89940.1 AN1-type zinc finger domain-containing protein [Methanocella sp.]